MIFSIRQTSKRSIAGACVIAYLTLCLLAPWFHQHPGHDHAEITGGSYHSHASTSASRAQEFDQDYHAWQEALHLLEGPPLFEKMQASIEAHFGQIIFLGKYAPQIDFLGLPSVSISPPAIVAKTSLKLPPIQAPQDYFVLIATGLSPPLA